MAFDFITYLFWSVLLLFVAGCGDSEESVNRAGLSTLAQGNTSAYERNITIDTTTTERIVHHAITATLFWVGEAADESNAFIANDRSAWDDFWQQHYGGVDTPDRTTLMPAEFTPGENPFYVALPYNDFLEDGSRDPDAMAVIPWAGEKAWGEEASIVKNRWIALYDPEHNRTAYAQWEDAGPFVYDDAAYLFGGAAPRNRRNDAAGIDLSPAVWIYLGYDTRSGENRAKIDWYFVDADTVPEGPWKRIVTTRQTSWE